MAPRASALKVTMRIALLGGALAATLVASVSAAANSTILTYHGAPDRAGRYVMPGLTYGRARGLHLDSSFNPTFPGDVYAQPLFWRRPGSGAGVLIVATEEEEVYAFGEKTGAQIWKRTLGEPVMRSAAFHCGNIWPLGVTGTPVIDEARATLYLDATVMRDNQPRHQIYALSLADGSVEPGWPVDVATALGGRFDPTVQNQRSALALFAGRVFVPFGGPAGDCGGYHGRVIGFSTADPGKVVSFSTLGYEGGIWAQGGVTSDGSRSSSRPATPSSSRDGATRPCCASVPTSPARSRPVTISHRRTGEISTPTTSISAAPRQFPSTSQAPRAPGS